MSSELPPPLFLTGPTATGKSELAVLCAELLRGEIISVDSMQVYRGLDIGTAKPSAEQRARLPHHLIDCCELHESFDAACFVKMARTACQQIQRRGSVPIFCGGTGFYLKAYFDGLGDAPGADPKLRVELEQLSPEQLLAEIQVRDPALYERMDRNNPRRLIRAVEVIRLTGRPFSEQRAPWTHSWGNGVKPLLIGFSRGRDELVARIDLRVEEMFRRGLVAETESLLGRGLEKNRAAMQALGYRQVVEFLKGKGSLAETIELVKIKTRQFAKRQLTWFRRQLDVEWIDPRKQTPKEIAELCSARYEAARTARFPQ